MTTYLLDVNVLLALMWRNHRQHHAAQAWFGAESGRRWATCAVTQAGFVRLCCNPIVVGRRVDPSEALLVLATNTAAPAHEYWLELPPVAIALAPFASRLVGHQQLTDAYLLSLAEARGGILATFDQRLSSLLPAGSPTTQHLETLTGG